MYYQRPLAFRIIDSFFRHWRLFSISLLTIVALLAGYVLTRPKTYVTTYTCVLNADTIVNPLSGEGQDLDYNAVESTVNHFETLVQTKDFIVSALDNPDGTPVKLNKPIDFNDQDSLVSLQKNISISTVGNDAFAVSLIYGDADDSEKILQAIIQKYVEQNAQEKSSSFSQDVAFISSQVDDYKNKLTAAESALAEFKAANVSHLPSQQDALESQLVNYQEKIQDLTLQLAAEKDKQAELRAEISQTPQTIVSNRTTGMSPLEMQVQNLQVQLEQDMTLKGMKSNHPEVVALQQQIAKSEAALAANSKATASLTNNEVNQTVQPNPQYQLLNNQLLESRITEQAAGAELTHTQDMITQTQVGASKVPEEERILANLMRDYQFNSDNYNILKRKLGEAILNEQLNLRQERGQYNLYLTSPPQSSTSKSKILMLFAGGVFLALIVAIGLVVASEAMDRSFRDPFDTQRALGVPVLAMLPESPDLHVADSKTPKLPGGGHKRLGNGKLAALLPGPTVTPSPVAATAAAAVAAGHTQGNFSTNGFNGTEKPTEAGVGAGAGGAS